jgi:uncharacterized cupredoxin-like copper-binding protein
MRGLGALILLGSLGIAACGPTPDTGTGPTAESGAAMTTPSGGGETAAGGPVSLETKTQDSFVFEPKTWTTTSGAETAITLDNSAGTLEHSWVLLKAGATQADAIALTNTPADDPMVEFKLNVQPGQMASGTFVAPAPGEYIVACHIAGHAAGGMTGTLTVN